ncbi:1-deoxy-D-xylulose-5-phosphate reductoisomerase [Stappia sp. ES.058]|uniref:1-deoxy-D-xylulose-5-phosphate reductoisomerase n=1 Tax=Stappia sp. ES.058 TaxID=1881061 RepID=UPI00087CB041|nr:1-deoxy-D-xylulose-5-phosphate reductoisomerase [Stappia sp. ES.058]SDU11584.1 1-deoxy-D-xylulose 5-phosphate reductoisomerase [Stappia sp. ES.058]
MVENGRRQTAKTGGGSNAPLRLSVLGASGSIGASTLDLVAREPDRFDICTLTANTNAEALAAAAIMVRADHAVVADESAYECLKTALSGTGITCAAGPAAVAEAASRPVDMLVAAIVGAAGLAPTLAAVRNGTTIALANKECLVCAGDLFMSAARASGATILPVDSEHNAVFQVFEQGNLDQIECLTLTASGGPFRAYSLDEMRVASPEAALKHPNWSMGARISIDSATMMNKGFEIIEAHHLFPLRQDQIEVLVHPQSVVHGMVQYSDGSVLAQLGAPDMRTPISHCLAWPRRMRTPATRLDLAALATLTFEAPDPVRFPALRLARAAMAAGAAASAALNAADEVMVKAFLDRKLGFLGIAETIERVLARMSASGDLSEVRSIEEAMAVDSVARRVSLEEIAGMTH